MWFRPGPSPATAVSTYIYMTVYVCICMCVYLCVRMRVCMCESVCVDWDGDSPKLTSEGCLTKTICLADGNMSPSPSLPSLFCLFLIICAG